MNPDSDLEEPLYRVVCAAIKDKLGLVFCGARHRDSIMNAAPIRIYGPTHYHNYTEGVCGFIDNKGQFLTREQAWVIAEKAGQIRPHPSQKPGILHSEDLY